MNQETIIENLHRGICTLTTKNNDSMRCTLHSSYVPRGSSPLTENTDNHISVWDLETQSWKSFDYNSIQSCNSSGVLKEG